MQRQKSTDVKYLVSYKLKGSWGGSNSRCSANLAKRNDRKAKYEPHPSGQDFLTEQICPRAPHLRVSWK